MLYFQIYSKITLRVQKYGLFAQLYKNSIDCFVLEVLTVDTVTRFESRICITIQGKEIKILYIATQLASQ